MTEKDESLSTEADKELDKSAEEGEQTQTLEEADASLNAGFQKVTGTESESALGDPKPGEEEKTVVDESKNDDQVVANPDDKTSENAKADAEVIKTEESEFDVKSLKNLPKRLRKVEGMVGSINDRLSGLTDAIKENASNAATKGDAAKTADDATTALKNIKEIEESIGEFKEFEPVKKELEDIRGEMAEMSGRIPEQVIEAVSTPGMSSEEIIERVTLNVKYPTWETDTQTSEFRDFMLHEGPSVEEYGEYSQLIRDGKNDEANAIVDGWEEDNPSWWEDRGQYLFSDKAEDSIKMLDRYSEIKKGAELKQSETNRRKNRLENSVAPTGVEGDLPTVVNDEEGLNRGFKKVAGKRIGG